MTILNALKALYNKVTSKTASGGSIGAVVQELADNWPEGGGSTVVIDSTLSKSGQAADAKATGDALNGKAPATHTHTASQITDLPAAPGNATTAKAGLVKQAAAVTDAVGETPTKAEFDTLLAALRAAGIVANN